MNFESLQQKVCEANKEIHRIQLAILTWGNASEVDREKGVFAIKPSGVSYENLNPADIPIVSLETGKKLTGELTPSSDTETHLELYRQFPEIGGIVHTHSPFGTAWAQAQRAIPCLGTTHADTFYGAIPCTRPLTKAEIEDGYERNTGKVIVEHFRQHKLKAMEIPGVLVSAHAPFTWGKDALQAVTHAQILEEVATMALNTIAINPDISPVDSHLLDKHYLRKHGAQATYGQINPL